MDDRVFLVGVTQARHQIVHARQVKLLRAEAQVVRETVIYKTVEVIQRLLVSII